MDGVTSPVLQELLGMELATDPTTTRGLTNHLPMALVAKQRLGANDVELKRFAAVYSRRLSPLATARRQLNVENWKTAIGDHDAGAELRSYFARRIAEDGPETALREHLPALLPGIGGAGFHGVIRLAYAIELSFRTLVDQYLANYEDADFVAA